ncbi:MAG: ribbon-helix-helix domain-containing protein [Sulfolobales archaeon]|uniref:ribbon-helix-helix domain-containing protein n=1 Tax=Thermofilum sp. TaxID=1961369 RepID=UPI0031688B5D
MPVQRGEKKVLTSIHLDKWLLQKLDDMVRDGVFNNRAEALRFLIRLGILVIEKGVIDIKQDKKRLEEETDKEFDKLLLKGRI